MRRFIPIYVTYPVNPRPAPSNVHAELALDVLHEWGKGLDYASRSRIDEASADCRLEPRNAGLWQPWRQAPCGTSACSIIGQPN